MNYVCIGCLHRCKASKEEILDGKEKCQDYCRIGNKEDWKPDCESIYAAECNGFDCPTQVDFECMGLPNPDLGNFELIEDCVDCPILHCDSRDGNKED